FHAVGPQQRERPMSHRFGLPEWRSFKAQARTKARACSVGWAHVGIAAAALVISAASSAWAGCNSGSTANTDALTSANCQADASGSGSLAVGSGAYAKGNNATSLGGGAGSTNVVVGATSIGFLAEARGGYSSALGYGAIAEGTASVAIGDSSRATGSGY